MEVLAIVDVEANGSLLLLPLASLALSVGCLRAAGGGVDNLSLFAGGTCV